jgi:hypothetical protein
LIVLCEELALEEVMNLSSERISDEEEEEEEEEADDDDDDDDDDDTVDRIFKREISQRQSKSLPAIHH